MEFSAGGLIYRRVGQNIEFLQVLDFAGRWALPKGHIEKKEKPEIAALREVQEETGIADLEPKAFLGKIDFWFKDKWHPQHTTIHKFVYFYLFEAPARAEVKVQKEEGFSDYRWVSAEELLEAGGSYKDIRPILEKAIEALKIKGG